MQIIGGHNKIYQLMVPEIDLDNFEFDTDDELEKLKHTFYLSERQWLDLLRLWREMNDKLQLLLDMCEEEWLYAKDIDEALKLIETYRADDNKATGITSEEHQQALDIVRDALLEAKRYNTYVEFRF